MASGQPPPPRTRVAGRVAGWIAEAFLRDALVNTAGLCSALVVAVALLEDGSPWSSAAVLIGGFGMALPVMSMTRGRPTRVLRMVVRGVLLVDLALLVIVLFSA